MEEAVKKVLSNSLVQSCIIILISIFIYELFNRLIFKKSKLKNSKLSNRNKTYIKLFSSVLKYVLIVLTIILILKVNGVNVDSLLAGAGIIGIVVGFAIQDALKDIIRGMTILADNYFSVGDVVKYKDITGKVVSTSINTTKIEDMKTFNIISIANRNIEEIEIVSNSIDIMVPLSYELPINKAEAVVNEIVEEVRKIPDVTECNYRGVANLKQSNIDYMINIRTQPILSRKITRQVNGIMLHILESHNIEIPYNQLDIHQK